VIKIVRAVFEKIAVLFGGGGVKGLIFLELERVYSPGTNL
jgi:patatin-like phospholipase/acyl hydrolase